jgi:hypothetical protein
MLRFLGVAPLAFFVYPVAVASLIDGTFLPRLSDATVRVKTF